MSQLRHIMSRRSQTPPSTSHTCLNPLCSRTSCTFHTVLPQLGHMMSKRSQTPPSISHTCPGPPCSRTCCTSAPPPESPAQTDFKTLKNTFLLSNRGGHSRFFSRFRAWQLTHLLGDGQVQLLAAQIPDLAGLEAGYLATHRHHGGVATHVGDVRPTAHASETEVSASTLTKRR